MRRKIAAFIAANGWCGLGLELPYRLARSVRSSVFSKLFGAHGLRLGARPYVRGVKYVSMGAGFHAGDGLWLEAVSKYCSQEFSPRIVIGEDVSVGNWTHIAATHYVEIGSNVLMGSKVLITDHNHGQYSTTHSSPHMAPILRPLDGDRRVVIGQNVWLGDGVVVTPGSSIGAGSVIGANSVVRGNIPPSSIAAGVPAKVIKTFNFDTQKWIEVE
jgi:lipopolysaccharide O-acetyltransferase